MKSLKHISQVNEKNSKRKIIKFIGSILCLTSSLNVALAEDTFLNLDHDTYYDHNTIHWGYWFTAPEDLTITGIDYPIIQSNDTYNAKIYELSITESEFVFISFSIQPSISSTAFNGFVHIISII